MVNGAVVRDPRGLRLRAQHETAVFRLLDVVGGLGHGHGRPVFCDLEHGLHLRFENRIK